MPRTAQMAVEYIDHMGDDLRVVNAARVSFAKQKNILDDRDIRLIGYLARHDHWTPFSHAFVTLRETVPIFLARQRFKHTVGFSYNEVSRRYVSSPPEFYAPKEWRPKAEGNIKQGSGTSPLPNQELWNDALERIHETAQHIYSEMIAEGVAPEQARMVLPQSMMTSYFVTGSLAAWARAYKLRTTADAQSELQQLGGHWSRLIAPLFPKCWPVLVGATHSSDA